MSLRDDEGKHIHEMKEERQYPTTQTFASDHLASHHQRRHRREHSVGIKHPKKGTHSHKNSESKLGSRLCGVYAEKGRVVSDN